jgi:hypothetical protein
MANDQTPKVTGMGGIFFFSDDPEKIKEWYGKNLGLKVNEWGSNFEFRNANRPEEINYLQWSPFEKGSDYFAPSRKEFMINYGVTFPMFSKVDVNGDEAHEIYKYLKKELGGFFGGKIKWNFTKFLIDSNGRPVKRFSPFTKPEVIDNYLAKKMK